MDDTIEEMRDKLHEMKLANEFKGLIKNTKNLIKRDTQYIPSIDELDDKNKGVWVEHDETNFHKMFEGLLDYCADEEFYDNLDWNTVNYTVYGADYYQEKFPGFSEEVYEILAKSTEEENKFIDNRLPPMKIKHEEVVLSFK
jgi:hypothetical protein